ncbi:hypothetical protein ASZ90_017671 [hydrocarbon metagenome]|uniref:Uncharacterized protein n=1 Tax=hydrocarbon metagenome TaxID=938273 RepID=A0A0W8E8H0_9ZZZZ
MFRSKLIMVLVLLVIGIMFLLPIFKSNPYISVALWFLGLGIIIMAFIQTLLNQIKSNKMH